MAMSLAQTILLLLTSLFFLPVFSQVPVPFEYCDNQGNFEVGVENVVVADGFGDDVGVFLTCHSTGVEEIGGETFVHVNVTSTGENMFSQELCLATKCNSDNEILLDRLFELVLGGVPLVPDKDTKYTISMETKKSGEPSIIRMCVIAKLNTKSISAY